MAELFASGRVVDCIMLLMLMELAALILLRRKSPTGASIAALVTNMLAGAALLLSLRAALTGSRWQVVSMWLLLALVAHVADLKCVGARHNWYELIKECLCKIEFPAEP